MQPDVRCRQVCFRKLGNRPRVAKRNAGRKRPASRAVSSRNGPAVKRKARLFDVRFRRADALKPVLEADGPKPVQFDRVHASREPDRYPGSPNPASGRRLGQRLACLDHIRPEDLGGFVADHLGVVRDPLGDLIGITGLQSLRRLALDKKFDFPLEYITGLDPGMIVAASRAAGRNFRNTGDCIVAGREIDLLQRRALDAGLLGDCGL